MGPITIDDELKAKLSGLAHGVELCGADGKPVGRFVPEEEYSKLVYAWAKAEATDEELNKARASGPGRPLAEIWKRLGAK